MRSRWKVIRLAIAAVFCASTTWAQQAAGISGVVRDSSNAVLPGVTVEAASPALIEKTRLVTTDGEGRYSIVDLRPGTYTVTFSLPGFSNVVRHGVELQSGFTASINATMSVGSVEESVTVTAASPVVDVQSSRQQQLVKSTELEALPAGNIGLQTLAYVTPGFATTQADVGGTRDTWSAQGAYTFFHGKTGTRASYDGFRNQYFIGAASGVGYITDQGNIQEMQLETTGMGAESGSGSTSLNAIPKSGSNVFRGTIDGFISTSGMQGSNIDDALRAYGINSSAQLQHIYRAGAQLGGPFKKDKVWFFAAIGRWGSTVNEPGAYFNAAQGQSGIPSVPTITFVPDASRPAASYDWYRNHSLRTTYQATASQRVNFYFDIQKSCRCTTGPFTGANAIESERGWDWWPSGVVQGTWTKPVTSRLLLEAGASWQVANWVNFAEPGVRRDDRSILELTGTPTIPANFRYGATSLLTAPIARTGRSAERFTASYVTGTHNFKLGVTDEQAFNDESRSRNNTPGPDCTTPACDALSYDFSGGRPSRIQYYAQPYFQQERQTVELGLFAQDAWTIRRVTLNLGLRFDYINMGFPAADLPAGPFTPARHVDALSGVPDWKDINPRVGISWDVHGNGRTAVKASAGRYNQLSRSDMTRRFHPFSSSISSAFRSWTDRNNDFVPDCDLSNFALNGECGSISNVNFGKFLPQATQFDDSVIKHNRDFLWDINLEVDHELLHGLSVSAAYNHNWDGNFIVTETLYNGALLGPDAYDEFCITVPNDPRIPNGGQKQCGYYDVKPQFFGQGTLRVTNANEFGKEKRYWDGLTFAANGRLPHGIQLGGGVDFGRQVDDHCFTVNVPNQPNDINNSPLNGGASVTAINPFCRIVTSWGDTLDTRFRGSFPFKAGLSASFIYRNTAGAVDNGLLTVSSSQVTFVNPARTALNAATTVMLFTPNAVYGPRFNQLDLAVNKTWQLGWARLRTAVDLYNALNSNSVQGVNTAYNLTANTWLKPTQFLDPRLARVTASIDF